MNPYNHHEPVTSRERFVGREKIINDLQYDLELAKSSNPQYINIGLTGKEGAGKTSLSHILEIEADTLDFQCVRIKIDEAMVEDEIQFFQRVYQSIVSEIGGSIESGFLKAVGGAVDKVEVDLKFVRAYMDNNSEGDVSDKIIQDDLEDLYEKIGSPGVLIILDNSQHLSSNPLLLQKINNIFESIDGYILSLVGTEQMFSGIENAFSPTARMFDKFRLTPFESYDKTAECILKPLKSLDHPPKISKNTIREIHNLTGGRPYELNLILFHMFKIYEERDGEKLHLSPEVIEKVVEQMGEWRRPVNGKIPDRVDLLNKRALNVLLSIIQTEPIDEVQLSKYHLTVNIDDLSRSVPETESEMEQIITELIEKGIIRKQDETIELKGGIYLKTFLKYYLYSEEILTGLGDALLQEEGIYSQIHHRLIDSHLLADLNNSHTHFNKIENSQQFADKRFISHSGEATHIDSNVYHEDIEATDDLIEDAESENVVLSKRDLQSQLQESSIGADSESYYSIDRRQTITLDIRWLGSAYKIIFHSDSSDEIDEIKSRLRDIEAKLRRVNIEIGWVNQFNLTEWSGIELSNGNPKRARSLANLAIEESNRKYPIAWELRADSNHSLGEFEDALSDVNMSLDLIPKNADSLFLKSEILLDLERVEDAVQEFEQVVQLDPTNPDLWANICHQLCHISEFKRAKKWGERGIEQSGGNTHLRIHLAESQMLTGNFHRAIDLCSEVVAEADVWSEKDRLWTVLSDCYRLIEEYEISKKHISRISDSAHKSYMMGVSEAALENDETAKEHITNAISEDSSYRQRALEEDIIKDKHLEE